MKHILVKWESEDTWDVYPVKRVADVAIGMELLRDPASALEKFQRVVLEVVWQPGKPPAPATILAIGNQASMERKRNRLALEAAESGSPATGAKRTCDHLEQIESLEQTVGSLKKEVQELKEELAQARQCIDAARMVKRLKHMLENATTPAEPVGIAAALKVGVEEVVGEFDQLLQYVSDLAREWGYKPRAVDRQSRQQKPCQSAAESDAPTAALTQPAAAQSVRTSAAAERQAKAVPAYSAAPESADGGQSSFDADTHVVSPAASMLHGMYADENDDPGIHAHLENFTPSRPDSCLSVHN
ncbi:uncharacterized protein [Dermacentor andersoni]|uniref:uncharacterized protein n=1 Tax=Dermacentor andersoni TaxID=34620 RepID=UPI002417A343|nr:uncharacterized protein LOC126519098 [Dermacentor andersoni]